MSSKYDPESGGLRGQRRSTRRVVNTAYDPEAGYTGAGTFTRQRGDTITVGPVCHCSLLIVPEELESQWQCELKDKSNLRHRIVLRRVDVAILRRQAEAAMSKLPANITSEFPTPEEVETLDVVVTTMERMGSKLGKRNGCSQNDGMRGMRDGLAQVHWARIIIDEGHELGGKGLSELAKVLGATLASATWVLSATPNRAGSGHFKQVDRNLRTEEVASSTEVIGHFMERVNALAEEEVVAEAGRCMSCGMCFECDNCVIYCPQDAVFRVNKKQSTMGRYVDTDYDKCIGCHICADVCPTGYIEMGLGG